VGITIQNCYEKIVSEETHPGYNATGKLDSIVESLFFDHQETVFMERVTRVSLGPVALSEEVIFLPNGNVTGPDGIWNEVVK